METIQPVDARVVMLVLVSPLVIMMVRAIIVNPHPKVISTRELVDPERTRRETMATITTVTGADRTGTIIIIHVPATMEILTEVDFRIRARG